MSRLSREFKSIESAAFFLLALFLLLLAGIAASEVHSFDIFWQLQSGKHILQTKSFIYQDIFSLAAEVPRFEHCWLHDIIFYGVYLLGGYTGISLFKGLLVTVTMALLMAVAKVRKASWLAILAVAPVPLLSTFWAWKERPQLWTFLFFALFLLLLENFRAGRRQWLWFLVPVMALWSNLHAGAILAFPLLVAYLAGEGIPLAFGKSGLSLQSYLRLWCVFLGVLGASFLTPYGAKILEVLLGFGSGSLGSQLFYVYNIDWKATTYAGYPAFFWSIGLAAVTIVCGWRRFALRDLFLLGGLTLMGLKLERHTPFFLFSIVALVPIYLDTALENFTRGSAKLALLGKGALLLLAMAGTIYFSRPALKDYGLLQTGLRSWHYPVAEAQFVKKHNLPGNIYNSYGSGGYLMWVLYPDYKVFWDGRQDSREMFVNGLRVSRGLPGWEEILARYGVHTLIVEACSQVDGGRRPLLELLRRTRTWELVFAGESYLVFVRRDVVEADWLNSQRLPDIRIEDTVLSEATRLSHASPPRPNAFWEMTQIYLARQEFSQAKEALWRYLELVPSGRRHPRAEGYLQFLLRQSVD